MAANEEIMANPWINVATLMTATFWGCCLLLYQLASLIVVNKLQSNRRGADKNRNRVRRFHQAQRCALMKRLVKKIHDQRTKRRIPQEKLITPTDELSCANFIPSIRHSPSEMEMRLLRKRFDGIQIPVTPTTFPILVKYSRSDLETRMKQAQGNRRFSQVLHRGIDDMNLFHEWIKLKTEFLRKKNPARKSKKSYYNYLLIDPRVLDRSKFQTMRVSEKFNRFLHGIFYVGKGTGNRGSQHFLEAKATLRLLRKDPGVPIGEKTATIHRIWNSKEGVVLLKIFQFSSEEEALAYEASMIDAIGLTGLSNQQKGCSKGYIDSEWFRKNKSKLGSFLLFQCFARFDKNNGCKKFYLKDN